MAIFKTKTQKIYELEQRKIFEDTVAKSLLTMRVDKAAVLYLKRKENSFKIEKKLTPWDNKEAELSLAANKTYTVVRLKSQAAPELEPKPEA